MSTRTLRSRVIVRKVSLDGENLPAPSLIPVPKARKGAITMASFDSISETTKSPLRSSSNVKETTRRDPLGLDLVSAGVSLPVVHTDNGGTSHSGDTKEDDSSPWTLVQRSRVRSLDSANVIDRDNLFGKKNIPRELSTEQKSTIETAKAALTAEQKEIFLKRHEVVNGVQIEYSHVEPRPSNHKGKGIDSHEWGNLNLNEEELDIMGQEATLKSYKSHKENLEYSKSITLKVKEGPDLK